MTHTIEHGITKVDDALLCQELDIEESVETTTILGMVSGKAQHKHVFTHSDKVTGTVKGSGPLTIAPGVGDSDVTGITGGITVIESVKQNEAIAGASGWEYSWTQYPHAEAVAP